MITWIQIALQKHHKVVFSVLLFFIIIAFVFTIGAVPFFGDSPRGGLLDYKKNFYGFDLSSAATSESLRNKAYMEAVFAGANVRNAQQLEMLMLRKAYLLSVANELGMRGISDAEVADYVRNSPYFFDESGKFSEQRWNEFKSQLRIGEAEFNAIVAENAMTTKIAELIGGPGYGLKAEIEEQYNRYYGKYDFEMATLSFADFKPEIPVTQEILENYFKLNAESYRIGDGYVLQTVFFPAKDFAAKISAPTDEQLSAFYGTNMRKYMEQRDGKPYIPQLSEIREKVVSDYLLGESQRMASTAAEEFVMGVYDSEAKFGDERITAILGNPELKVSTLPAIRTTDNSLPEGVTMSIAGAGFKLDENLFYSDPVVEQDGAYVVILKEKLASYVPEFADVKDKVEANYVAGEKARLFAEKGAKLDDALKAAVAEGKSFEDVAKENGAKVEKVQNFSMSDPTGAPQSVLQAYNALGVLSNLKAGTVSKMQTVGDNGYIFYLEKFYAPEQTEAAGFATMVENYQDAFGRITSNTIVSEMIEKVSGPNKGE